MFSENISMLSQRQKAKAIEIEETFDEPGIMWQQTKTSPDIFANLTPRLSVVINSAGYSHFRPNRLSARTHCLFSIVEKSNVIDTETCISKTNGVQSNGTG